MIFKLIQGSAFAGKLLNHRTTQPGGMSLVVFSQISQILSRQNHSEIVQFHSHCGLSFKPKKLCSVLITLAAN